MKKNAEKTASEILAFIKAENIVSYTNCLTRLRLNLKENSNIDLQKLKSLPEVIQVLPSVNELQIVLGPGFAAKVTNALTKIINFDSSIIDKSKINTDSAFSSSKSEQKMKQNKPIQVFFTKFSKIFAPMIIGFIGAGILAGIAGIIYSIYGDAFTGDEIKNIKQTAPAVAISWYKLLNLFLEIWKNAFLIIVGWRTAEIFGGSGVLGAIVATIYVPAFASLILPIFIANNADSSIIFLGIKISNPLTNWLTVGFRPEIKNNLLVLGYPSGNILGVFLSVISAIYLEKIIKKFMFGPLDVLLTPTITLFLLLLINFFLLIPISGCMYLGVSWFFSNLYQNPLGAFVLASVFLLAVVLGIHQGFIPIYAILIKNTAENGTAVNGLFPILAMAGISQIGTGIALWLLADRGSSLRKQIQGAIIPAFCGIGEPMIYSVTLPRIKAFITTAIGAGIGGLFLGAVSLWGNVTFGLNATFGPSGFLAVFMMTTKTGKIGLAMVIYLSGAIIAMISGFLITFFAYSKIVVVGVSKMKQIYFKNNTENKNYTLIQQVLWSLVFMTIIGIFIFWILEYYHLPKAQRITIKQMKVE